MNQGYCLRKAPSAATTGRRLESKEYAYAFDATNPNADTQTKPTADKFANTAIDKATNVGDKVSTYAADKATTVVDKITTTAAGVKDSLCSPIREAKSCDAVPECEWVNVPTKPTIPSVPVPSGETPLFTKEFCHPVAFTDATIKGDFEQCISKTSATECNGGNCMWSNGKGMIPDHDFCAPADLTDDLNVIQQCVASKDEATCAAPCKWRRGKQAASEIPKGDDTNVDVDLSGPFFSKRFCHPVSTEDWEKNVDMCIKNKVANTCPSGVCVWSSAKELIPPQDFCAPAEMTIDAGHIMGCVNVKEETACIGKCQWYKGTGDFTKPPVDDTKPTQPSGWCKWDIPAGVVPSQDNDPCYKAQDAVKCNSIKQCSW